MPGEELERTEIEALLETRRELGLRYDAELVDGFVERIERVVDQRVSDDLAQRQRADRAVAAAGPRQLALGIVSLVAGIPMTALSLAVPESADLSLVSLMLTWGGIASVNAAHAWQSRRA
jgi:hypothetical protein